MKKVIALTLSVLMIAALLVGCGKDTAKKANPLTDLNGSLESIVASIYDNYPELPEDLKGRLMCQALDVSDAETLKFLTGVSTTANVKEAAISETITGSQAYSVVLVRVNDKANAASIANEMLNGVNQSKWICVTADVLRVVAVDDLVLLVMIDSKLTDVSVDTMIETFGKVCDQKFDIDLKK